MPNTSGVLNHLRSRSLVAAITNNSFESFCAGKSVYLGIDPTADGIHVGHLIGVLTLQKFQKYGYRPIALIGGATGMIGDPTGRSLERNFLGPEEISNNVSGIRRDLENLIDFSSGQNCAKLVNNNDWYGKMGALDLLRNVGKHFRVNTMLSRESVKSRLDANEQTGLSFTEFSYQLLQGYDFLHLYQHENCALQIGGSDQWGNIVSGVDLIKRVTGGSDAFGLTIPLLTTSSGEKIGKSAGNAIWLNPEKTSDYAFYQYFLRLEDDLLETLFLRMTDIDTNTIEEILENHAEKPHLRVGQRLLAENVTTKIRGKEALSRAQRASDVLFGGSMENIPASFLLELSSSDIIPTKQIQRADVVGSTIVEVAVASDLCKSKGEARRLIQNGGLYVNNNRVSDVGQVFEVNVHALDGTVCLFRVGKKDYKIIRIVN